jgi:hypothetical protein
MARIQETGGDRETERMSSEECLAGGLDRGSFHASFKLGEALRQKLGLMFNYSVAGVWSACPPLAHLLSQKGPTLQNQPSQLTRSDSTVSAIFAMSLFRGTRGRTVVTTCIGRCLFRL